MQCASCGFENPRGMKFCGECGQALANRCPECGTENPPPFKFCGACGTALRVGRQKAPAERRTRHGAAGAKQAGRPAVPSTVAIAGPATPEAERRQLTVLFCDLVSSTALSAHLDPEEWREVVQAYQATSAEVVRRFDGYIAQYLGDGLLVYFGYPRAHEDDAQRAVRAALGIVEAIRRAPLLHAHALQVRIGIHTGLVVVGEIGGKQEQLAVGDTPNLAARLQGLAAPDTVVISAATHRLIAGFFDCQDLGLQPVKGLSAPIRVYRVLGEGGAQSRLEVEVRTGKLTPLVGRAHERGLLLERWAAAQAGEGQVVLLSGEPGIGKSRLVQEVKERVIQQGATCLEFRCSPYAQNSAFAPVLAHLQRALHFERGDQPQEKLAKLQQVLARYHFPQADTLALLAALLSLPPPEGAPTLTLSPQKQKQKTHEALVEWLLEEAARQPVYCVWEDLHWADPSTLELLGLLLDQVPTARFLLLLTARPELTPPWSSRTHLTPLTLARLPRTQAAEMIERVTGGKPLPAGVHRQILQKTDGVPLFVEELTKMVLESGLLREGNGQYELTGPLPPLAIPTTLHDSLMARLDRLATAKEVAQVGATLGREFSYELLQAVSPVDEPNLQQALAKLVEAEVLYQRGLPPQARYVFKHALIQDAAYQSLLKSRRQWYHEQIAQILEERFPEAKETQPELLAHHYTEAGLITQSIPYWQRAGERAVERSAHTEAINHLTNALDLLKTLPDTPERAQQELPLQIALSVPLMATKGYAAPEVAKVYTRARELCREAGEAPQLFSVLAGLWVFYEHRPEYKTAHEIAEQSLRLAQRIQDPSRLMWAHYFLGETLRFLGESALARVHLEEAITLYDPQQHRALVFRAGGDPGTDSLAELALALWSLGYPDQALKRLHEALTLAREVAYPFNLATALAYAAWLHSLRRDGQATKERAEATIALASEQGFPYWLAIATVLRGWALVEQGQGEEGKVQMCQGLVAYRATSELPRPHLLALLAEAHGKVGQTEEGLNTLAEALTLVNITGERFYEAELYRQKGELTLQKLSVASRLSAVSDPQSLTPSTQSEAEACFLKAIDIARRQRAKSLELRAAVSLARLWQQQGKKNEARQLLAEIYGWFTEGFDTKDLQEAKALLAELEDRGG